MLYYTILYYTTLHYTILYYIQYNTIQYYTIQYNTIQYYLLWVLYVPPKDYIASEAALTHAYAESMGQVFIRGFGYDFTNDDLKQALNFNNKTH